MEGFSIEKPHSAESEKITKEAMVAELKKGIEEPGVRELLIQWCEEQESVVQTTDDQLRFEMLRAEIYRESGHLEIAREALEDALDIAYQEDKSEFIQQIEVLLQHH